MRSSTPFSQRSTPKASPSCRVGKWRQTEDCSSRPGSSTNQASGSSRPAPSPSPRKDGHGLGSAITYGRRYNVLALAGVAPEDDDGNAASNIKAEDRRDKDALMAITDTQLKEANRLLKILDATEDNIAATVRLFTKDRTESVEGMMKPEAEAIIKALRKRVAKDKSAV
jgi:hypothetical protein